MADDDPGKSRTKPLAAVAIAIVAVLLVGLAVWLDKRAPQTSDAYAFADTIDVAPEVAGRIVAMPIHDNQLVQRGDLLFRVDPRSYELTLAQARAQLASLDQQIKLTQRAVDAQQYNAQSVEAAVAAARVTAKQAADTLHRVEPLLGQGYASPEEVDQARTASRAANANLEAVMLQARQAASAVSGVEALVAQRAAVEAQIALAELQLGFTTVRAPFDGRVTGLNTTAGQLASPLKPLFTLIATDHWYVIAQFRETVLPRIRPGDPATVYLMGDPDQPFQGRVDSIGFGVAPNVTSVAGNLGSLPFVQRSINWVHVSQRFPVRIRVAHPDPRLFRVGASALAIVHPADRRHAARQ